MHDMWPFTGGCHYAGACLRYRSECGACPALGSNSDDDLSRTIWRRKRKSWDGLPFQLITPSRWLASCARSSALFHGADVAVIPNTLDTDIFRPQEQAAARQRCSLPQGPKLVLFGAIASLSTSRKGAHLLMPALEQLQKVVDFPVELVVLGATGPEPSMTFPLLVHYAGHVSDEAELSAFYASADAVVLPSTEDNFPNVALEALACGRPCAAFEIGGMGDLIVHGETGYLAKPFLPGDLAAGIAFCLRDDQTARLRQQARDRVERNFAPAIVAEQHLTLYEKLLMRSRR
jgi:glycosyltransferase involved in cell wall biosynthesis